MKEELKKIMILVPVLVVISFLLPRLVCADSCSIVVSCTVPAIPGVNAPALLVNESLESKQTEKTTLAGAELTEEQPNISLDTIAEESKEEIKSSQEESPFRLVKTIYSR